MPSPRKKATERAHNETSTLTYSHCSTVKFFMQEGFKLKKGNCLIGDTVACHILSNFVVAVLDYFP